MPSKQHKQAAQGHGLPTASRRAVCGATMHTQLVHPSFQEALAVQALLDDA